MVIEGKQVDISSVELSKFDDEVFIYSAKFVDGTELDDFQKQALDEKIDTVLKLMGK